jgi:NAD(P)-dependent dehydrogenase (short-subunit alcohol dehydrogenase family)
LVARWPKPRRTLAIRLWPPRAPPAQLDDLAERYGDRVLVVALDVTDAVAAASAFETAVGRFGRVDVVVNNAGYANVAPVETAPEEDFRRQFETNFWGVYNVSKAALPVLKAQGAGTIVQFSSVGGRVGGTAGLGSYQAAKFAVDGLTRVLAAETAPLGIHYLVVEPGGFATDWAGAAQVAIDYSGRQIAKATAWQAISASADFRAAYPIELPIAS